MDSEFKNQDINILIVDDNPFNLKLLAAILSEKGYKVRPVPNGNLALSAARAIHPNLILLDINMPGMSGYEVCQELKDDKLTADIPIIFITVKDEIADKVRGFDLGAVDYITKPFHPKDVLARVETHVKLRHLQRILNNKNIVLENEIKERKRLELQLRQAHKMEALATFSGGIAHDFNNILSIILGNTELAMDEVLEYSSSREYLENVRKASLKAKNIILRLLSATRHIKKEYKPQNFALLVKEALEKIHLLLPENVTIKESISDLFESVEADPKQILEMMLELCKNSLDAIGDNVGIIEIFLSKVVLDEKEISLFKDLKPGTYIEFKISDTGCGITKENIEYIFDPYFTTGDIAVKSGMGLAIVNSIVRSHEGAISVSSEEGKGTTFRAVFPIKK
ncbi:MAG: response regulator [Desulfobacterales bacterium]|nr:response regulator [Desulfobacterales bacterium]